MHKLGYILHFVCPTCAPTPLFLLECCTLKMAALWCFKTQGSTDQLTTQRDTPKDWHLIFNIVVEPVTGVSDYCRISRQ